MNSVDMLVKNILDINYHSLPDDVVDATKKQVLDTLAVILGGSSAKGMEELVNLVKDWGGKEESTVLIYGGKIPSFNAALVNSTVARALDFDDVNDSAGVHPSGVIVPACLAIAERKGGVSGKELIVAVALGYDLISRLSRAAVLSFAESGWDFTNICGFFGAAAAAGKILGFNQEQLINALGIAYQQSAGSIEGSMEGHTVKALGSGFAAKGGIMAALIAEKGLTGSKGCLEGKYGFYNTYHRGLYHPELLTAGLGRIFEGKNNSQKAYPCCRFNGTFADAVLAMVKEYDIKPEEVIEIVPHVGIHAQMLCEPLEVKRNPPNPVASQFSLPWSIASAVLFRRVGIGEFTEAALRNPETLKMTQRVVPRVDPELDLQKSSEEAIVDIKIRDGQVYSKRVLFALGSPQNPMSFQDIADKFRACCAFSIKPIANKNIDAIIETVEKLETVTDVCQLVHLLN
ncbi:MmgE/PrpD family protein [Chloroflexota bacterium]